MAEGTMNQQEQAQQVPAEIPQRTTVAFGTRGLAPTDLDGAWRCATLVSRSGLAPKGMEKPEAILVAAAMGAEIGLTFMQSIQSIAVINGRPGVFGDMGKALLYQAGCKIEEASKEVIQANKVARCKISRPGHATVERTFSVDDAKTAGLWGNAGPWTKYPWRQLAWRAFWFAARDAAADILRGMHGAEEIMDLPAIDQGEPIFSVEEIPEAPRQPAPAAPVAPQASQEAQEAKSGPVPPPEATPERRRRNMGITFAGGATMATAGITAETFAAIRAAAAAHFMGQELVAEHLTATLAPSQQDLTYLREAEGQDLLSKLTQPAAGGPAQGPPPGAPVQEPPPVETPTPEPPPEAPQGNGRGDVIECRGPNLGDRMTQAYCEAQCREVGECAEYRAHVAKQRLDRARELI